MTRNKGGLLLVGVALLASACSSETAGPSSTTGPPAVASSTAVPATVDAPQPVIVDYSPTVSDVGGLLYLLSHPAVEVVAITLPVTGEAGCDLGIEVTLGILAMFERDDVPVACDGEVPAGAEEWPADFLAGHENLTLGLPDATTVADERPAHQLIADVTASTEGPVALYAVAPLTNVARALDRHPDVIDRLDRIVIMGGAVDAPGNVAGSDAEWNLWIDVPSAARVMASGVPITLVPLDATNDVPVPGRWQADVDAAEQSAAIQYLSNLVRTFPAVTSGFYYLWDELAGAIAAGEGVTTSEELNLLVVEDPGAGYGSTARDPSGTAVEVATAVPDPAAFYAHFLSTLAGSSVEARAPLQLEETSAPSSVDAASSPAEVLAFWLVNAFGGEVDAASTVVAADAPWVGLAASADAFVEGSAPFAASDIEMACASADGVALCHAVWNDLWIEAIPEIERGDLRVQAEVVEGAITAFTEFVFGPDVVSAFDAHVTWLQAEQPGPFAEACAADVGAAPCSQLVVDTVQDWVAGR